tara:strand:+ start:156 stop:260 length:105 start_codon:yes stop_codon:yes gene_type:complete
MCVLIFYLKEILKMKDQIFSLLAIMSRKNGLPEK